jgi:hypothetical protein
METSYCGGWMEGETKTDGRSQSMVDRQITLQSRA